MTELEGSGAIDEQYLADVATRKRKIQAARLSLGNGKVNEREIIKVQEVES